MINTPEMKVTFEVFESTSQKKPLIPNTKILKTKKLKFPK
jgi:hypothetical protein